MKLICPEEEIELGMSNLNHEIDEGFDDALRISPGEVFGIHSGWDFNGRVWFFDGRFHEEVWVSGSPREIISEGTLKELMESVNDSYGWS